MIAVSVRSTGRPPLPSDEHEHKRDHHQGSRYQYRLESRRIDVHAGEMKEGYRKYREYPESCENANNVPVPLQELQYSDFVNLFSVACQAFRRALPGELWRHDAGSANPPIAIVALFLGKSGAAYRTLLIRLFAFHPASSVE